MEITTEKILREEIKDLTAELDEAKSDLEHALEKWRIAQGTAMERKKKIEQLEKKLEEADVDFIRVRHSKEVEKLRELCRDMYGRLCYYNEVNDRLQFDDRLEQLGLIHETEYDPDTGLKWGEQNG